MEKKPEPAIDTTFHDTSKVSQQFVNSPLDVFMKYMNEDILDKIHFETNLKSVQKGKPIGLSREELKVFLGINIMMSYHHLPHIAHYWSGSKDLNVQPIAESMSRDRFQSILTNLHFNDNTKMDPSNKDKLFKIKPLIDHLNQKFIGNRALSEHLSIDESMIRFKGRSSLKQYNPMKPIKRGFKLWCLSDNTGYVFQTKVYTGKAETQNASDDVKKFGLGGEVVLSLLKHITEANHKVFFDHFFSSLPLLERLKALNILACGTIRTNRKDLPSLAPDKSLKRGEFDYHSTSNGITVYKWIDKKPVHFVSNYHEVSTTTVQRRNRDGSKSTVPCPQIVEDYYKYMGGTDKHDMLRELYGVNRKNCKWWHRLFFGLLDMAIVNSFVLFCDATQKKSISCFDFRREIALGLLSFAESRLDSGQSKRRKVQYSVPPSVRLTNVGIHKPLFYDKRGRCEVCSKRGIQSRPGSKCSHCGVFLCCNYSKNCFNEYHT